MASDDSTRRASGHWATVRTPDDLGRFLARRRSAAGWTQQELAQHLDIPPRYLHEIESGKHTLAYTRLFDLLRALEIEARLEVVAPPDPLDEDEEPRDVPARPVPDAQAPSGSRIHVGPRPDGRWSVVREGASRPTSVHSTRGQAEQRARKLALVSGGELVVHDQDGRIREIDTYVGRSPEAFGFSESARRASDDFYADFDDSSTSER